MTSPKHTPPPRYVPPETVAEFARRLRGRWLTQNTEPNRHHRRAHAAGFWGPGVRA